MPRLVVDMEEQRPFWRMPEWFVERLRAAAPGDWEVVAIEAPADGTGDGGVTASAEALAAVDGAEVYVGFGIPAEILDAGRALCWVHTGSAGVGRSLTPEMRASDVVFTNSAGVHAPPIAETVLGMILHFARGLDLAIHGQVEGRWSKAPFDAGDSPLREVAGSTVGILGLGGIGRAVAARAGALGARVIGLRRGMGDPVPGVELVHGPEGLHALLDRSDFLVVAAPETAETRGLIDAEALARMKRDAVLVNVARGSIVDEDALVAALSAGRLRGAALDVFRVEPLPADHAFWALPNVLLTPHVSGYSRRFWEREVELIEENLTRYLEGQALVNVVDKARGY